MALNNSYAIFNSSFLIASAPNYNKIVQDLGAQVRVHYGVNASERVK